MGQNDQLKSPLFKCTFCAQSVISIYPTHCVTSYTELVFPPIVKLNTGVLQESEKIYGHKADKNAKFSMAKRTTNACVEIEPMN